MGIFLCTFILVEPFGHWTNNMIQEQKTLLSPVSKSRLHEEIVTQIQRKIITGELSKGEKLPPERDLAESLDVNRATVREALKKLELLGLIEIRHGDGIYVNDYLLSGNLELLKNIAYMSEVIDLDILKNFLDIRKIIGPKMAGYAALKRTDGEIEELEKILNNDSMSTLEKDVRIHDVIAKASKNLLYIFILNFFNQMFHDFGYLYFSDVDNRDISTEFHREIIKAIKKGDAKRSEEIMANILIYAEEMVYKNYKDLKAKAEV